MEGSETTRCLNRPEEEERNAAASSTRRDAGEKCSTTPDSTRRERRVAVVLNRDKRGANNAHVKFNEHKQKRNRAATAATPRYLISIANWRYRRAGSFFFFPHRCD